MADLSNSTIGFLGCGKISSAVCRGFAGASGVNRPKKILVSLRSEEKSKALQAAFPELVFVYSSSEDIVKEADVIFIGLLPGVAREVLPTLPFDDSKLVISMMAAVDYEETVQLVRVSPARLVRTVPLPSAANRTGPVLVYPPSPEHEAVLRVVSTPVVCQAESNMKPMIAVTGHISSFFELMATSQKFIVDNGKKRVCCSLSHWWVITYNHEFSSSLSMQVLMPTRPASS